MMKDYVKCCNCDFIGVVDTGEDRCTCCNTEGMLTWVDESKQEIYENDLTIGKNKLIEIIKNEKYFGFENYFYVTFGSLNGTDCAIVVINDKISLHVVVNDDEIVSIGADEVSGGDWYDIEDNQYIKECLNNVYLALASKI